ncbi:MAG: serine/threonine-protein kinase [Myxococcales bacterium]|nr:serine/threonine-protein kinase [Myxococcales bacterium]
MSLNLSVVREPAAVVPTSFGAYVVESLLGEGTMGCVYQARHQTLGRRVAVKSLHEKLLNDASLVRRFLQEARLVNTINHPHIVEVHDFVEAPGQVYAVMELLEGETLTARLASKALSLAVVVSIATQVAEAIEAAHALSVVHRDLKPDNIFLSQRDGADWVKVLDFGVAKLLVQEGPRVIETQNGDLLGTPRYMAPEQAAGLDVDARTDIYAFGTVLFELLAGKPPFESTVYGQLAADIITRPPPPVPTLTRTGDAVPEGLRRLVTDCLAKNADHRPASMGDVLWRLRHLDEDVAPLAQPPPRRWMVPALVAVVVATLGGAASLLASGPVKAVAPIEAPPPPPPVVVVPPEAPSPPRTVSIVIESAPPGANVVDSTGASLGTTPLTLKRELGAPPLEVRLELKGYEPLSREFGTTESLHVELPLKRLAPLPVKKETRPVSDGVLDPF